MTPRQEFINARVTMLQALREDAGLYLAYRDNIAMKIDDSVVGLEKQRRDALAVELIDLIFGGMVRHEDLP
jgi:hypothetical protein